MLYHRLIIGTSLGVGYFLYRKLLYSTMINQNLLLDERQISELRQQNHIKGDTLIAGHIVNKNRKIQEREKVLIIGSGIIGLTQAYKSLEDGYSVILLDRQSAVAQETSNYNGCVYTPSAPRTFINPSNLWTLICNMTKNPEETNMRINPLFMFEKYFFLFALNALLLAGTTNKAESNAAHQVKLGSISMEEVEQYKQKGLMRDHFTVKAQIGFFDSQANLDSFKQALNRHNLPFTEVKYNDQIMSQMKTHFGYTMQFVHENNIETRDLCQTILERCIRSPYFEFLSKTNVKAFALNPKNEVIGTVTNQGIILSNKIVICAAQNSKFITDKLGIRLPIIPVKGWAIGIPYKGNNLITNFSLYTPNYLTTYMNGNIRISACAEIAASKLSEDPSKDWGAIYTLNHFKKHTGIDTSEAFVHSCFRPVTADDLPIISTVPNFSNIYINAGHGSKGLTYSFGSAKIISELMKGEQYPAFDVKRFYFI